MMKIRQILCCSFALLLAPVATVLAESPSPVHAATEQLAKGTQAKDFQLHAVAGELSGDVRLSDVNADGPVVVVVLRGYPTKQCPACTAQVGDLIKNADKFAAKNARLLLVYPGDASQLGMHADDFLHGTKLPAPLTMLLDPGYQFTNAYGLRWNAPRETAYPSTIVVDESGKITFVKISNTHGGRVKSAEILSAL
ncbi:peroxiredoxin [Rhodopirellula rubra]|uniref:thioredoxin-dependent peroxiredoxin n=1 Tax=Aporhodopirellula rubra TaxID=980271 RepID=A0A7W5H9G0_9BACT|nr:peroxiredoxin family protein [Aporhodopirellula rubra]MBB3210369.1 peroxiredoxin [Aporhodopirellula rubra]